MIEEILRSLLLLLGICVGDLWHHLLAETLEQL